MGQYYLSAIIIKEMGEPIRISNGVEFLFIVVDIESSGTIIYTFMFYTFFNGPEFKTENVISWQNGQFYLSFNYPGRARH